MPAPRALRGPINPTQSRLIPKTREAGATPAPSFPVRHPVRFRSIFNRGKRCNATKKARGPENRSPGLGVLGRFRGRSKIRPGPATWMKSRKRPGPPPASIAQLGKSGSQSRGRHVQASIDPKGMTRTLLIKHAGARCRSSPGCNLPLSRLYAAARRATRRLPLGEPPLVITTHSITSFTLRHPGLAGVQPRSRAGFSPSHHVACDPSRPGV